MTPQEFSQLSHGDIIRQCEGDDSRPYTVDQNYSAYVVATYLVHVTNVDEWVTSNGPFKSVSELRPGTVILSRGFRNEYVVTSVHGVYAVAVKSIEVLIREAGQWRIAKKTAYQKL